MKARIFPASLFLACLTAGSLTAADAVSPTPAKPEAPKAAASDDAAAKAVKSGNTAAPAPAAKDPAAKDAAKPAQEPATVLPQVEVRRSKISDVDIQIQELEQEIAKEKKKTKATETDKTLNDPKLSSSLAIFGGSSSESREALAQERINLMEAELTLLEAIAHTTSKTEKDEYLSQLAEMKAARRDLEKPPGPGR